MRFITFSRCPRGLRDGHAYSAAAIVFTVLILLCIKSLCMVQACLKLPELTPTLGWCALSHWPGLSPGLENSSNSSVQRMMLRLHLLGPHRLEGQVGFHPARWPGSGGGWSHCPRHSAGHMRFLGSCCSPGQLWVLCAHFRVISHCP